MQCTGGVPQGAPLGFSARRRTAEKVWPFFLAVLFAAVGAALCGRPAVVMAQETRCVLERPRQRPGGHIGPPLRTSTTARIRGHTPRKGPFVLLCPCPLTSRWPGANNPMRSEEARRPLGLERAGRRQESQASVVALSPRATTAKSRMGPRRPRPAHFLRCGALHFASRSSTATAASFDGIAYPCIRSGSWWTGGLRFARPTQLGHPDSHSHSAARRRHIARSSGSLS